jgi:hypothetical protein
MIRHRKKKSPPSATLPHPLQACEGQTGTANPSPDFAALFFDIGVSQRLHISDLHAFCALPPKKSLATS